MNKSIELTQTQIKALEAGATMFLLPIRNIEYYDFLDNGIYNVSNPIFRKDRSWSYSDFITDYAPIQKSDKDIFIQEEFRLNEYGDYEYRTGFNTKVTSHLNINQWQYASQMTKEQSRYSFNECIDVIIIKVKDIPTYNIWKVMPRSYQKEGGYVIDTFSKFYNQQLKERKINRTYEDNDYVFLIEFA